MLSGVRAGDFRRAGRGHHAGGVQRGERGGGGRVPGGPDRIWRHRDGDRDDAGAHRVRHHPLPGGHPGRRRRRSAPGTGGDRVIGNVAYTIVILGIVLGVLVFVHELGHYIAAKAFGVWVHRFAIGIGKPIPGLTFRRGETEWAIAWLPLGGYVKMASREHEPASSVLEGDSAEAVPADRVFEAKPVWQRMIIILSGVTLNTVFALMIFTGLAWKNGRRYDPTTTLGHVTASALPPEAKALASVPLGTRITAVDGRLVHSWDDITEQITAGSTNQIIIRFDGAPDLVIPLHRDALAERSALATAIEPEQ